MQQAHQAKGAIDFLAKFTSSEQFEKTFREGMTLVEETANYLDADGRMDSKLLDRTGAIAYATEVNAPHHALNANGILAFTPARHCGR